MEARRYEVVEPVAGFREGEVLDVTARFGDWHGYALQLESDVASPRSRKVLVTESPVGFDESDVLDETARFGDWQDYDLTFDPYGTSTPGSDEGTWESSGPLRITMDELRTIAEPVDAEA